MRILGSVYTFIVGVLVLIPQIFNTTQQMLSYVILDDLVFPIRDFIEILMFSYMFYQQSNKRKNLDAINDKWRKNNRANAGSIISETGGMGEQEKTLKGMKEEKIEY